MAKKFLVFSWYFIGILSTTLLKVGFIGIFRQYKHRFGILFLWLPFHWYRFGFGFHFPESGISNTHTHISASNTHFEPSGPAAAAA